MLQTLPAKARDEPGHVGSYQLVARLAEGGMGTVYRARAGAARWRRAHVDLDRRRARGPARSGIVHRDLEPSNVLLTDGIVTVVDFGLSRHALANQALAQSLFFRRELEACRPVAERTIALNPIDGAGDYRAAAGFAMRVNIPGYSS